MKKTSKQKLKEECIKLATQKKLQEHPRCTFCNQPASTCHHLIRQSRSNYLRCDPRNLIPICQKCHYTFHNGGYAELMTLQLVKIYGSEWHNGLLRDGRKTIKDNIGYWMKMKEKLSPKGYAKKLLTGATLDR